MTSIRAVDLPSAHVSRAKLAPGLRNFCVECNVHLSATFDALPAFSERNMTLADTAPAAEPRTSLRERKKLATRRSLRRHALDLVAQRGFVHVTVEDIAEAADVSPRTFFNYFPSKEAALFGADPDRVAALREGVLRQAPGESALAALRQVMVAEARIFTHELSELGQVGEVPAADDPELHDLRWVSHQSRTYRMCSMRFHGLPAVTTA